jgi:hypothetical protein
LILAVFVLLASLNVGAREYTDVYYDPSQDGWGVFLIQSNTTQFMAFFIYGPDGKPIWYVVTLEDDGSGTYTGTLYATTGTYFADPWQGSTHTAVGTASFKPIDNYHATLTYTVNGVPTVTKTIQRQTLRPYVLSGNYSGSAAGSISGCSDPGENQPAFRGRYDLAVTQVADESATLTFTFVDMVNSGTVCTLSGSLAHFGRLYQLNGQGACVGPDVNTGSHSATIESLHPTGQGIEGRWTGSVGGGCTVSLHFAAVLNTN